jgi:hypothetical protein
LQPPLASINTAVTAGFFLITTEDYLDLIDWTTRLARSDKRGRIEASENHPSCASSD